MAPQVVGSLLCVSELLPLFKDVFVDERLLAIGERVEVLAVPLRPRCPRHVPGTEGLLVVGLGLVP